MSELGEEGVGEFGVSELKGRSGGDLVSVN